MKHNDVAFIQNLFLFLMTMFALGLFWQLQYFKQRDTIWYLQTCFVKEKSFLIIILTAFIFELPAL